MTKATNKEEEAASKKKAPAKKATAKKTTAKKETAVKTPAKKTVAKKTTAKKTVAKTSVVKAHKEVKAPKGYQINPEVFVKKISSDSYEYLIVKEEKLPPFRLQVEKKDTYGNCLEGAEFTLYKDETCQKEVAKGVTNQEGMLTFTDLEVCKNYYLKETKAPTGYFEEETIYSVYSEESKDFHLEILNEPEIVLPKTGSTLTMGIPLLGISLCSISLYFMKKKRRKCI